MRVSGSDRGFSRHRNRRKKRNSQSHSQLYFTTIPSRGKGPLIDAYAQHLERQLVAAIDAFATGRMSDDQAAYLDYFVRQGLLSNRPSPLVVEYRRLENEIAIPRRAPGIIEEAGPDHPLLLRGDPQRLGDPVPRRFLTAPDGQAYGDRQSMRLALANDLTSLKNPLTTRVIVNRLYQYLFREGIVATPDNFGKLGAVPKDPDLLDALATQFVGDGWSIMEAAIQNYETAYRMQTGVPELVDLRGESEATQKVDSPNQEKAAYARQCLLARRLVEGGVGFIELSHVAPPGLGGGNSWDQHGGLRDGHSKNAFIVDQPIGALIQDLKSRRLFDETLVIWSGEFGRVPFVQGKDGRDHGPSGFSLWLAGGGVKGGTIFGATDEYGYRAVEDVLTIHDSHATILHLLGLNHEKLTFRYSGRDFRLTDVHGQVIRQILRA